MKKIISLLAIILLAYILIMISATKYLTSKMDKINISGHSYLPQDSPKLSKKQIILKRYD